MTEDDARVEQIVRQLLENRLTRGERIQLLRELVRAESDATDELMEAALSRLMERLDDE